MFVSSPLELENNEVIKEKTVTFFQELTYYFAQDKCSISSYWIMIGIFLLLIEVFPSLKPKDYKKP